MRNIIENLSYTKIKYALLGLLVILFIGFLNYLPFYIFSKLLGLVFSVPGIICISGLVGYFYIKRKFVKKL